MLGIDIPTTLPARVDQGDRAVCRCWPRADKSKRLPFVCFRGKAEAIDLIGTFSISAPGLSEQRPICVNVTPSPRLGMYVHPPLGDRRMHADAADFGNSDNWGWAVRGSAVDESAGVRRRSVPLPRALAGVDARPMSRLSPRRRLSRKKS